MNLNAHCISIKELIDRWLISFGLFLGSASAGDVELTLKKAEFAKIPYELGTTYKLIFGSCV